MIATRIGALKTFFICLGFYLSSMVIILICLWENAFWTIGFLVVIFLACALRGRGPLSTAMFTQVRTPWALFATTSALTSAINAIPDTFTYTLCGLAVENYGVHGYRYIFIACAVLAVIGFVLALTLDRRLKAGKDSEWHFSKGVSSNAE